jgi:hypothetical protein
MAFIYFFVKSPNPRCTGQMRGKPSPWQLPGLAWLTLTGKQKKGEDFIVIKKKRGEVDPDS